MNRANATDRCEIIRADLSARRAAFECDVRAGLTNIPKSLPCRYFYDQKGSELFDRICDLPEYYLSRAETQILRRWSAGIADQFPHARSVIELGCGSAFKTRILLEALLRDERHLHYGAVDLSESALRAASIRLLRACNGLRVTTVADEYLSGIDRLGELLQAPRLILFLGSNIGNFDRDAAADFLTRLGGTMSGDDAMFLGVDLRKEKAVLERAYDDSQGVTAAFNKNILARINRELAGEFDLDAFNHRAIYDESAGRIEMYLVSTIPQRVRVAALDLTVEFGLHETIHTENSYKYSLDEVRGLAHRAGLSVMHIYLDEAERFCLAECRKAHGADAPNVRMSRRRNVETTIDCRLPT